MKKVKKPKVLHTSEMLGFGILKGEGLTEAYLAHKKEMREWQKRRDKMFDEMFAKSHKRKKKSFK